MIGKIDKILNKESNREWLKEVTTEWYDEDQKKQLLEIIDLNS